MTNGNATTDYDDILEVDCAAGADLELMGEGCHYDYRAQVWVDGHDHAHFATGDESLPLMFCGADLATCTGEVVR